MAPIANAGNRALKQRSTSSKPDKLAQQIDENTPDKLARRLAYYIHLQEISTVIVTKDPAWRDKVALVTQSDKYRMMNMETDRPDAFGDIETVLAMYDDMLAKTPSTYEEHIVQMHVGFSAYMLLHELLDDLLPKQTRKFRDTYLKRLDHYFQAFYEQDPMLSGRASETTAPSAQYRTEFPTAGGQPGASDVAFSPRPMSTSDAASITVEQANKILEASSTLMDLQFASSVEPDNQWRVDSITQKRGGPTRYEIVFSDCGPDALLPMEREELVTFMCESVIV